jgi:SAM-dependent methyltransferase
VSIQGTASSPADAARRDALATRLFEATLGAFDLLVVHLGLDLGLYEALAEHGSLSPPELAARAGIDRRYAREWLEHQAVGGILDVDDHAAGPDERRYTLPEGHREVLLDPDSLSAGAALPKFVLSAGRTWPALLEAYRSGGGVDWSHYPGLVEAQDLANRPVFARLLTDTWLPAIPDVHERLMAEPPARVADLACGTGWSSIAIARGYPLARVDGLDIDRESIDRARRNADGLGLDDRLRFHHVDAGDHNLDGQYDVVTIFEAVHDLARPVEVLTAVRLLLAPGGTAIVVDEKVAETFTAPGDEIERIMYSYSVLFCLANGLADQPSIGTGTVMRPDTFRRYATAAGFGSVEVLPIEHDTFRLYRLRV